MLGSPWSVLPLMSWDLCHTSSLRWTISVNGPKRMHSQIRKRSLSLVSLCPSSLVSLVSLVSYTLTKAEILESSVFQEVCTLLGIRTTALHPQSDGIMEHYNQAIEAQLATFFQDHQRDGDRHLPLLLMSYHSAVYETTKFTSAMLMFVRELHVPLHLLIGRSQEKPKDSGYPEYVERLRESVETVHNFACVHQQESSLRMKRRYDMHLPLKVWILYGFTIPKQRRASRQNRDGHRRSHTLLWNGLMMLCTGFSGVLGKSPKWYTENAFGSTLG